MRFFKLTAETDKSLFPEKKSKGRQNGRNPDEYSNFDFSDFVRKYAESVQLTDSVIAEENFGRDVFINFSEINEIKAVLIMATGRDQDNSQDIQQRFTDYLGRQKYEGDIVRIDEITGKHYRDLLSQSCRRDFINDYDDTISQYGLFKYMDIHYYHRIFSFDEFILDTPKISGIKMLAYASEMQTVPSLEEEIERVCKTTRRAWRPGNPVHYVVSADEGKYRNEYFMLLLKTLYSKKRIVSKRFTQIDYEKICDNYNAGCLNEIYQLQTGGVVVFDIRKETLQNSSYLKGGESRAEEICRCVSAWKNKVLTVFLFPRNSEKTQEAFFAALDGISLIKIEEGIVFDKDAKSFLRKLARENGLASFPGLCAGIEKGTGYSKNDLAKLFDRWYGGYLKEKVFPQYATGAIVMSTADNKPKGAGIERMNELIGLTETKELISEILDFAKAQTLYSFGEARAKQSLHMIFTGNPGTAKTTVARLVAQILKENKVLENGDLIEVGRGDLVDMYVGGTAPRVKRAFKRARGNVLFVDEAYSLVDHRDGLYGDEAIATIVQEMENYRDEVVVIFAGYPDKMESFLQKNPGLRSRIGFHVSFPDYSPDELFGILELLAKDNKIKFSSDVRGRVIPFLEKAAGIREFGNGRYARNLLEKARMRQAARLMRMDPGNVTEQVAATMVAEDFEEISLSALHPEKRVGFI